MNKPYSYSRQYIDKGEMRARVEVLNSDCIIQGTKVEEFEIPE